MEQKDSMLELAMALMEKKRKPHTIQNLAKEVFEIKGLKVNEHPDLLSQFVSDFMLCGFFICCGEDKKGVKVWDIKTRQSCELLENDGAYLDDPYGNDEEVIKNELKDEFEYLDKSDSFADNNYADDQDDIDEDKEEKDDIEEALSEEEIDFGDDDELPEDSYDDEDILN